MLKRANLLYKHCRGAKCLVLHLPLGSTQSKSTQYKDCISKVYALEHMRKPNPKKRITTPSGILNIIWEERIIALFRRWVHPRFRHLSGIWYLYYSMYFGYNFLIVTSQFVKDSHKVRSQKENTSLLGWESISCS